MAGVGSATLHRHFPTRWGLLQAIFKERVDGLASLSQTLSPHDPAGALEEWLVALTDTIAATRGLAAALELADDPSVTADATCHHVVSDAGTSLLKRAQQAGSIDPVVTIDELLTFATAISSMPDDSSRLRMLHAAFSGLALTRRL